MNISNSVILEVAPQAICSLDKSGNIIFANRQCLKILCVDDNKDLLGAGFLSFANAKSTDTDLVLKGQSQLQQAIINKNSVHIEQIVLSKKNGDSFYAELWLQTVETEDLSCAFVVTFNDISNRVEAEVYSREFQRNLADAQSLTKIGSWSLDIQKNKLIWSDEIFHIFGIDQNKFGASYEAFLETIHIEDREYVNEAYTKSIEEDVPYDVVHRIVRNDNGEVRYVHELCKHIRDHDGQVVRSVGSVHDITESLKSERSLRESQQYNRMLFEQSPVGLALTKMDGELVDVNPAYANIVGRSIDEIKQLAYWDITPAKYAKQEELQLNKLTSTGRYGPYEKEYIHKDGHLVPVTLSGLMIEQDGETYIWSSVENITQRKMTEKVLQDAHDNLEEKVNERTKELAEANERLKELDELKSIFIASMSHELRTPLNSILGFSSVLLTGMAGDLNELQKDQLLRVNKSAKHLLDLISDIIDISKVEAGHIDLSLSQCGVLDVVNEAVSTFLNQLKEKNLEINVDVPNDMTLISDRRRLLQVIINFLSNAIKYSETGLITMAAKHSAGEIIVEISDTGIGIADDDLSRLFEPFERIDSSAAIKAGGTGLGLYLTKKIVCDALKGDISVVSEVGKGSTFSISLPLDIMDEVYDSSVQLIGEEHEADCISH